MRFLYFLPFLYQCLKKRHLPHLLDLCLISLSLPLPLSYTFFTYTLLRFLRFSFYSVPEVFHLSSHLSPLCYVGFEKEKSQGVLCIISCTRYVLPWCENHGLSAFQFKLTVYGNILVYCRHFGRFFRLIVFCCVPWLPVYT